MFSCGKRERDFSPFRALRLESRIYQLCIRVSWRRSPRKLWMIEACQRRIEKMFIAVHWLVDWTWLEFHFCCVQLKPLAGRKREKCCIRCGSSASIPFGVSSLKKNSIPSHDDCDCLEREMRNYWSNLHDSHFLSLRQVSMQLSRQHETLNVEKRKISNKTKK